MIGLCVHLHESHDHCCSGYVAREVLVVVSFPAVAYCYCCRSWWRRWKICRCVCKTSMIATCLLQGFAPTDRTAHSAETASYSRYTRGYQYGSISDPRSQRPYSWQAMHLPSVPWVTITSGQRVPRGHIPTLVSRRGELFSAHMRYRYSTFYKPQKT